MLQPARLLLSGPSLRILVSPLRSTGPERLTAHLSSQGFLMHRGPRPTHPSAAATHHTLGPAAEMIMCPGAWTQGSPSTCTGVALRSVTRK